MLVLRRNYKMAMEEGTYLLLLGGLGDCFRAINNPDSIQAYFPLFLKENNYKFKIIAGCHGPIEELFRDIECENYYITDIDEILCHCESMIPFSHLLHKEVEQCREDYNPYNPKLDPEEEKILNEIKSQGDYFVIHPFTGVEEKTPVVNWKRICKTLKKKNINSVILGSTYKIWNSRQKQESIKIKGTRIINMVNRASLGLSYALTTSAKGFIGCDSCWFNLALFRIKSIFLILTTGFTYSDLTDPIRYEPLRYYDEVTNCNHHLEVLYELNDPLKTFIFNLSHKYVLQQLSNFLKGDL